MIMILTLSNHYSLRAKVDSVLESWLKYNIEQYTIHDIQNDRIALIEKEGIRESPDILWAKYERTCFKCNDVFNH